MEKPPGPSDKKSRSELLAKLRKERSAEAARNRRNKENKEYDHVKKLLPIDEAIAKNLDKASVIRITISFLRMCKFAETGPDGWDMPLEQCEIDGFRTEAQRYSINKQIAMNTLKSLDGFLMVLATDGKILYVSETVNDHLGLNWEELPGSSVHDIVPNQEDRTELKSCLRTLNNKDSCAEEHINLILRFKSQREKRHGSGLKSKTIAPTKSCQVIGTLRFSDNDEARGLICCVIPLMSINNRELPLPSNSFFILSDLKFVVNKCDPRLRQFIELEQEDMMDVSVYSMIHPNDIDNVIRSHQQLLTKGQSATLYFRWFQRNKGHKWCKSTLSRTQQKGTTEDCILWVNQIISETPNDSHRGLDFFQLFPADLKVGVCTTAKIEEQHYTPQHAGMSIYDPPRCHLDSSPIITCTNGFSLSREHERRQATSTPPSSSLLRGDVTHQIKYTPDEYEFKQGQNKYIYSPGSSPEPSPSEIDRKPEIEIIDSSGNDPRKDLSKDPGSFPYPENINISDEIRQPGYNQNQNKAIMCRKSIQNKAKVIKKRPKSVLVMPFRIKNEPRAIKHHFRRDGEMSEPNTKRIRNDEQKLKKSQSRITPKERSKEPNLRNELETPGVPVVKEWKPSLEDARPFSNDLPKIRLPKHVSRHVPTPHDQMTHNSGMSGIVFSNGINGQEMFTHQGDMNGNTPVYLTPTTNATVVAQSPTPQFQLQPSPLPQQQHQSTRNELIRGHQQSSQQLPQHQQENNFQHHQQQQSQSQPQSMMTQKSQQIFWVPCTKIDGSDGMEYQKIPDMQIHVSSLGSQELRPMQRDQTSSRPPPFYITKEVSYSPMATEQQQVQPMFYVPTTGNNIMTSQNFAGAQIMGGQFSQGNQQVAIPLILPHGNLPNQQQQYVAVVQATGQPVGIPISGQVQQIGGNGPSLSVKM